MSDQPGGASVQPEAIHPSAAAVDRGQEGGGLGSRPDASERIRRYYAESSQDYSAWSPAYHMHFGYFRRGLNPLDLEGMLEEMTLQVLARAGLDLGEEQLLADLGCGLGASARLAARRFPTLRIDGVTLVPEQAAWADRLVTREGLEDRVRIFEGDYTATEFPTGRYSAAYAIESACHAAGLGKEALLAEAHRLLRPGGRLVVADGFLKGARPLEPGLAWCMGKVCANWAVDTFAELGSFLEALRAVGFEDIRVEDVSYRIAPSVLHVPKVSAFFLWRELRRSRLRMSRVRWGHLVACLLSPLVGMARWRFGYYVISARKRKGDQRI